jgi:hypothetical protein
MTRYLVSAVFLLISFTTSAAPSNASAQPGTWRLKPAEPDPVMIRASTVRDRFIAAIEACGVKPTYLPNVIANTPNDGIHYDDGDHAVHISRWSKLDPQVKDAMVGWAKQGKLGLDPERMWGEIFNEFLVAHELGHYLEYMSGTIGNLDNWQAEVDANRIALAFWALDNDAAKKLPTRVENYSAFLLSLPTPVPRGEDSRAYFGNHYEDLTKDLGAYGWYQGQFMNIAWKQPDHRSFCDWVHANQPHKQ